MVDPPRASVADAHRAGIRIHVVTGDYVPTAAEIARRVGIGRRGDGRSGSRIVTGEELYRLGDARPGPALPCIRSSSKPRR